MAGIRDSKTVDGVIYNYLTLDGKVVRQTWGSNVLDIIYDNSGLPYAFKYNGAYYIYVLNQQGDVIRIVNSTGATVAEYKYDAWGNLLVAESSLTAIGKINPIRYRGYYYDTETGFYYLQSRYYDPTIGRFINADSFASTGQGFIGYNMFAYCNNNPISFIDCIGKSATATQWWTGSMWWLCGADTVLPFGEFIYAVGALALLVVVTDNGDAAPKQGGESDSNGNSKKRQTSLPPEGEANTDADLYDENGDLKQTRHSGADGKAEYDIDYNHGGNHDFPHRHNWDWTQIPPRGGAIPLLK